MQPPASDIIVAHAPSETTLASYYAVALRTQGASAAPYTPPDGQSPQAIASQVRGSRALVVLVADPAPGWAGALLAGYRRLAASERWRRIVIIRRGAGQLSPEMQGLPWIEASDKPVEEVAAEVVSLLASGPVPVQTPAAIPAATRVSAPAKLGVQAGPPRWPGVEPVAQPLGDGAMTRRALLAGGLGIAALAAVAVGTSAVLTRGFGLFAGPGTVNNTTVVPPLLFTSSGATLYAVDVTKGALRWGFTADAPIRPAEGASDGVIYAISERGTLYALNIGDGKPLWQVSIPGAVLVRPVLAGNLIYTGSDDHHVYALNSKDGSIAWKFETGDAVQARPSVGNGVVYVGSRDHKVYALGAADGKLIWKSSTGGPVYSSAAISSDVIYIGSDDRNLRALRISDGHRRWNFTTGNKVSSSPVLAGDTVYVGSQDGNVYALQADAPKLRWHYRTGGAVFSSPVVANDVIFIGSSDHHIYALGTDGNKHWSFQAGDDVNGRLVAANGVVYAASDALYALDAAKGSVVWRFAAEGKSGYFSPGISQ